MHYIAKSVWAPNHSLTRMYRIVFVFFSIKITPLLGFRGPNLTKHGRSPVHKLHQIKSSAQSSVRDLTEHLVELIRTHEGEMNQE